MFEKIKTIFKTPKKVSNDFWRTRSSDTWNYKTIFPDRFQKQKELLEAQFIPLISPTDIIIELGCSDGMGSTFLVSDYCQCIDAYDISEEFIKSAKKYAADHLINARFQVKNLEKISGFSDIYDHCLLMGFFTCITIDNTMLNILKKINRSMKNKGYIAAYDSLASDRTVIVKDATYSAKYRWDQAYINLYHKAGFDMIRKETISSAPNNPVSSIFFLMQKLREV